MKSKLFRIFLLVGFLLAAGNASAQRILMEEKPDTLTPRFGPNYAHYIQPYFATGFIFGKEDPALPVMDFRNAEQFLGVRYKRKLSGVFSLGANLAYRYTNYNIKQTDQTIFLDTFFRGRPDNHKKERLAYHSISLQPYIRVNFDPNRGEELGTYIDFGAAGDLIVFDTYLVKDDLADDVNLKSRFSNLPFTNPLQASGFVMLGTRLFGLGVMYRITSLFKASYNYPKLPSFTVFMEINLKTQ